MSRLILFTLLSTFLTVSAWAQIMSYEQYKALAYTNGMSPQELMEYQFKKQMMDNCSYSITSFCVDLRPRYGEAPGVNYNLPNSLMPQSMVQRQDYYNELVRDHYYRHQQLLRANGYLSDEVAPIRTIRNINPSYPSTVVGTNREIGPPMNRMDFTGPIPVMAPKKIRAVQNK